MTTTAFRRIAFGAAPAVLLAGALAGCNDSAPSVQAPASSANVATSSDTGVPTAPSTGDGTDQSTDDPVPTDTGVPTVSAAPPSSVSADPAKVCNDNDTFLTPGAVAPSTKKAKWGKPLEFSQKYGGTVTITPEAPKVKKPSGDNDIFGPDDGQVSLLIKVTVKYKSGDETSIAGIYFALRDTKNNVCDFASLSDAVPKQQQFDDGDVSKTTPTYSGTLIYHVPANQDYKKYTLLYRAGTSDDKSSDAPVAWTN
ncbi:DUF4352 domain-containing protein [Flexivirga endophytica]|uniref:DUF4352 domain-containing protein n=1 Tax=Flexivirga endophytica TaxID=1849103 RepID=UPI00166AB215|nr:DUF4352 domain-containing protein [Flexivirga endophytica]